MDYQKKLHVHIIVYFKYLESILQYTINITVNIYHNFESNLLLY